MGGFFFSQMKTGRTRTAETLKEEIRAIASDSKLNKLQKVKRIFDLGNPTPTNDVTVLQFANDSVLWSSLKTSGPFWIIVSREMGVPLFDETDIRDNFTFSVDDLNNIMGARWMYEFYDLTNFITLETQRKKVVLRAVFVEYMSWYDSQASDQFLVLYASYLALEGQLVTIEKTRSQKAAPRPLYKQSTTIPSSSTTTKTVPIDPTPKVEVSTAPLDVIDEKTLAINTNLVIVKGNKSTKMVFYMNKAKPAEGKYYRFTIRRINGDVTTDTEIETNGLIARVTKFLYDEFLFVVLSGRNDSILLRIQYTRMDLLTESEMYFDFNPDLFDDVTYINYDYRFNVATNIKSVAQLEQLNLMRPVFLLGKFPRERTRKDLMPEEKNPWLKQEQLAYNGKERALTKQEQVIIAQLRQEVGTQVGIPEKQYFKDLTEDEWRYIRRKSNYVELVEPYYRLFTKLTPPITPAFKFGQSDYKEDDLESVAVKIIHVPAQINSQHLFHLAVLAKRYTNNSGMFTTRLYFIRYTKPTNSGASASYTAISEKYFELGDFVRANRPVKELNIIFHLNRFFYVEIMEQGITPQQSLMRSSSVLHFDFLYQANPGAPILLPERDIPNYAILNTLAQNGYKIYDFRMYIVPMLNKQDQTLSQDQPLKFDAIFYKYDYAKDTARLIFYKKRAERPGIADFFIEKLKPRRITSIAPLETVKELCYIMSKSSALDVSIYTVIDNKIDGTGVALPPMNPMFSLQSNLKANLSITNDEEQAMETESVPYCTFCGDYTSNHATDAETLLKTYYCDGLCQLLFCKTNRL